MKIVPFQNLVSTFKSFKIRKTIEYSKEQVFFDSLTKFSTIDPINSHFFGNILNGRVRKIAIIIRRFN